MFSTWYGLSQIKRLGKITQSGNVWGDKVFKIASDPKYDGYQRGLASMIYKFVDNKSRGRGVTNEQIYQLASELHKQMTGKFKRRKFYSSFRDIIWSVDLADLAIIKQIQQRNQLFIVRNCLVNLRGLFL